MRLAGGAQGARHGKEGGARARAPARSADRGGFVELQVREGHDPHRARRLQPPPHRKRRREARRRRERQQHRRQQQHPQRHAVAARPRAHGGGSAGAGAGGVRGLVGSAGGRESGTTCAGPGGRENDRPAG